METIQELKETDFNKYKGDDRFIHNVAYAITCLNEEMKFKHKKAMTTYTKAKQEFKVSDEFIDKAKAIYTERKNNILKNIGFNKLVFVGMGMDFKPLNKDYINNHRIRTYFKDNKGVLCFVEFGSSINKDFLRCDHALYNTKKDTSEWNNLTEQDNTEKRVYLLEGIRGDKDNIKYTKENILKLVNENFDTNFREVEVYDYFLNTSDYISVSEEDKK